jgi:cytochrome P450/NADPH-cytochrome P450 reductase
MVAGPLAQIRNCVEDGLFTAHPGEHNWEIAHRVLMPGTSVTYYGGRGS